MNILLNVNVLYMYCIVEDSSIQRVSLYSEQVLCIKLMTLRLDLLVGITRIFGDNWCAWY